MTSTRPGARSERRRRRLEGDPPPAGVPAFMKANTVGRERGSMPSSRTGSS